MKALLPLALLLALPVDSAAQQPSFTAFGAGCTFNGQTLAIGNRGLPRLGTSFAITYSGPNTFSDSSQERARPVLVFGNTLRVTLIPQTLLPLQPPGCAGFISPDAVLPTLPDPGGRPMFADYVDLAVPNNPVLLGAVFYAQWLTIFEQCGFAGCDPVAALTSDAAQMVVGI